MSRRMFRDRVRAGEVVARAVEALGLERPVVLGLPRGGVPVAEVVARALHAPLDVIVVRKLGVPWRHEVAMGAIGEGSAVVVNDDVVAAAGVGPAEFARVEQQERAELERRLERLRAVRPREPLAGRTAVLVDDGIATGATMRAAVEVARQHGAARVVVAAPVAPPDVVDELRRLADDVVVPISPSSFSAVGEWYDDFGEVTDETVVRLLRAEAPPDRSPGQ